MEIAQALDEVKVNYFIRRDQKFETTEEEILSAEGAKRLLSAYESVDIENLISLDSDEDLEKFLAETD